MRLRDRGTEVTQAKGGLRIKRVFAFFGDRNDHLGRHALDSRDELHGPIQVDQENHLGIPGRNHLLRPSRQHRDLGRKEDGRKDTHVHCTQKIHTDSFVIK